MAVSKKNPGIIETQFLAVVAALISSYFFGSIADYFLGGTITGGTSFADLNLSYAVYYFGFYLGLFFCLSFVHFAFIKKPSLYYYIIISVLLLTSLILIELFWLAIGYTVAGILLGALASYLIPKVWVGRKLVR